jgi:anti-sigma B factor antagonist
MAARQFEAQVRQHDGIAIIDLHGEINGEAEEALNAVYSEATARQPASVLLNFGGVDYINSKGIALIVVLLAQARKAGRRLLTSGLSEHYVEIFKITRLADFMTLFPDEATAIAEADGKRKG